MTVQTLPGEEHLGYAPERLADDSITAPVDPWVEAGGPARDGEGSE